jgi:hypothetical protein
MFLEKFQLLSKRVVCNARDSLNNVAKNPPEPYQLLPFRHSKPLAEPISLKEILTYWAHRNLPYIDIVRECLLVDVKEGMMPLYRPYHYSAGQGARYLRLPPEDECTRQMVNLLRHGLVDIPVAATEISKRLCRGTESQLAQWAAAVVESTLNFGSVLPHLFVEASDLHVFAERHGLKDVIPERAAASVPLLPSEAPTAEAGRAQPEGQAAALPGNPSQLDPIYRTGLAGKPTAWTFAETEVRRRWAAGQRHPAVTDWAEVIATWMAENHPQAVHLKGKSLTNRLSRLLRELKVSTK